MRRITPRITPFRRGIFCDAGNWRERGAAISLCVCFIGMAFVGFRYILALALAMHRCRCFAPYVCCMFLNTQYYCYPRDPVPKRMQHIKAPQSSHNECTRNHTSTTPLFPPRVDPERFEASEHRNVPSILLPQPASPIEKVESCAKHSSSSP